MDLKTTVCFTGHRPDKLWEACGRDPAALYEARHQLQQRILRAVDEVYTTFLCGMAQGVDIWAGEMVLSLQEVFPELRLVAVMPFRGHGEGWPREWKARLRRLRRFCSEEVVLSGGYYKGCFLARDRYMVDHAARVIGIWQEGSDGGTGYTVRYAQGKNRELDLVLLAGGAASLS